MGFNFTGYSLTLLMAVLTTISQAQFSFPKFDVELNGGFAKISADQTVDNNYSINDVLAMNLQAAAHWQINQNIGLGWTYSKSLSGSISYGSIDNGTTVSTQNIYLLMYGPTVRISSGRIKNWRPYLNLSLLAVEYVEDKEGYRQAHKTNAGGVGVGIMRRLGNKLYWNVLELSGNVLSEKIFWLTESNLIVEAKTGFTYNFGKLK